MNRLENRFGHWILRYRWLIIVANLLLILIAAYGAQNLVFTANYRVFFSADNPQLLAFQALEQTYSKSDSILFVLAPKNGQALDKTTLEAAEELTTRSWKIPYSSRVDSVTNFQHTEAEEDDLLLQNLVEDASELTAESLTKIRQVALAEPLLVNRLVADDAHAIGINVTILLPGIDETTEVPEVVAYARQLASDMRTQYPDLEIQISGMVMLDNAFAESSKQDGKTLIPLSFAVMALMLLLTTGGVLGTIVTMLVVLLSIVFAMGMGGWVGFPLSPPSASAPTIILTVTIANCVHILVTYLQRLRRGEDQSTAIVESLRVNLQPVFLASVTTALGFLFMNFSDVPPFRHLGNFVAFGVFAAFVLSVTFLPAVLSLLPVRAGRKTSTHDPIMSFLAEFVLRRRTALLWGSVVLVGVMAASIPRNELNDVFVNYFDRSIEFRRAADFTVDHLTGLYNIEYSLESGQPGGISEPAFLRDVDAYAKWYRAQPEVIHVNVITDIFKRLNLNMHADDPEFYRLPESRELAAQYLLLYEMSLPYGLDLNNQLNVDKASTRMTVTTQTLSSNQLLALDVRAQVWQRENASNIKEANGSGTSLMFANIGKRNIKAMLIGTTGALIAISMVLLLALRSFRIGLISLVPNLVPGILGFGLWGLMVGEVGLSLSIVSSMTLGIVVDDTVHFLSKYLRARRELGYVAADAVRYAFNTVGRAMLITSMVLVAGFLVLWQSSFELNSGMGILTALVIALALITDFLLLPALLMKFEGKEYDQVVNVDSAIDGARA